MGLRVISPRSFIDKSMLIGVFLVLLGTRPNTVCIVRTLIEADTKQNHDPKCFEGLSLVDSSKMEHLPWQKCVTELHPLPGNRFHL